MNKDIMTEILSYVENERSLIELYFITGDCRVVRLNDLELCEAYVIYPTTCGVCYVPYASIVRITVEDRERG